METYSFLREFADSWMLVAMTVFFVGIIFWAFRPGSRKTHEVAATAIFRNVDRPAQDTPSPSKHKEA
ncbi:MAG: cbb3-type cytochrome c oxidase subunit 3 [Gemmobacter sp.]|nr:cbb3-type cytochrome c oxidase subunit 3 [Gemmobacter sp.]